MLLHEIKFETAAETDQAIYDPGVFVKTKTFGTMLKDINIAVVGRKGSGKSAIRIGLGEYGKFDTSVWVDLDLREFNFPLFKSLVEEAMKEIGDDHLATQDMVLQNTWRLTIVGAIMAKSHSSPLVLGQEADLVKKIEDYFHNLKIKDPSQHQFKPDDMLDAALKNATKPNTQPEKKRFPLGDVFFDIEKKLMGILNSKLGAVVMIDDLDASMLEGFNDIVVPTIASLIKTARALVTQYGWEKPKPVEQKENRLRIKCFIPLDVLSSINDRHLDKEVGLSSTISWSASSLREMLGRHILYFSTNNDYSEESVNKAVDDVLGTATIPVYFQGSSIPRHFTPYEYLWYRTFRRPRDILTLTQFLINRAVSEDENATTIPSNRFVRYMRDATKEYCGNVITEYEDRYPNLLEHMDVLRNQSAILELDRFERLVSDSFPYTDTMEVLKEFFDVGVIGYRTFENNPTTGKNERITRFYYNQVKPGIPENLTARSELVIHPLFWDAYNIYP
ncbi:MAG: P-loop ATPase, Sll1717 family [Planctomycetota bacterium]|jgi:hypothetical protein